MFKATPLKGQKETDNTRNENGGTNSIELGELLAERLLCCVTIGNPEEKRREGESDTADWQVDVEAPAPGDIRCESTADQRTNDRSQTEDGAEEALEHGSLLKRHGVDDDDYRECLLDAHREGEGGGRE